MADTWDNADPDITYDWDNIFNTNNPDITFNWDNVFGPGYTGDPTAVGYDPGAIPTAPSSGYSWSDFLKDAGKVLSGTSGAGRLGQLAGFAGIASLLNKFSGSQAQVPTGYQGGIPQYTAARQQYAFSPSAQVGTATDDQIQRFINQRGVTDPLIAQNMRNYGVTPERMAGIANVPAADVERRYLNAFGPNLSEGYRRPGSGGITYFSPMEYTRVTPPPPPPPPAPAPAPAASTTPPPGTTTNPNSFNNDVVAPPPAAASAPAPAPAPASQASLPPTSGYSSVAPPGYIASLKGYDASGKPIYAYLKAAESAPAPAPAPAPASQRIRSMAELEAMTPEQRAAYFAAQGVNTGDNFGAQSQQYFAQRAADRQNDPALAQQNLQNAINFANVVGGYSGFDPRSWGNDLLQSVPGMTNILPGIDTKNWDVNTRYVKALPGYSPSGEPGPRPAGGYMFQYDPEKKNWFTAGFVDPGSGTGYSVDRFGRAVQRNQDFLTNPLSNIPGYAWADSFSPSYFPGSIYSFSSPPPGMAAGGVATLPAAKGRFVQGPGDGVSDHVPATIEGNQPARLADGEFVLPARIVSELGNGSSAAGARKLYAFMDRVERMTRKAKRGKPSGADKLLNKLA